MGLDRRTWVFIGIGLLVALIFGTVVSQFASGNPDGLEYVAQQEGFIDATDDHVFGDAPLADYGGNLGDNGRLNTAVAGAVGVLATLGIGWGVFWLARKRGPGPVSQAGPGTG